MGCPEPRATKSEIDCVLAQRRQANLKEPNFMKKPKKKVIKLKRSRLEVIDLHVDDLIPDEHNPNEMDEPTFDLLVEEIREQGFDEPIQVRTHPTEEGKWQISSGHHRVKAAKVIGIHEVPAVVKEYDDRTQKIMLVKRNMLHGEPDKFKLKKLYEDVAKGHDPALVQRELGFSDPKKLEPLIEKAAKNMTPKQKKKLDEAKENIKTIDDLSSVLNRIFKGTGSEAESGYLCFSFGGKEHHYVKIDSKTNDRLKDIKAACEDADQPVADFLQSIIAEADLPTKTKRVTKKRGPSKG